MLKMAGLLTEWLLSFQLAVQNSIWDSLRHVAYRQKIKNIDRLKQVLNIAEIWSAEN